MLLTLHYHRQKWNVENKWRDVLTNNDWKELNYPFDGACVRPLQKYVYEHFPL